MSAQGPSPWGGEAAGFVEAFRDEVQVDVDVDAAWAQFEDAVGPISTRHKARSILWLGAAAALAAAIALLWVVVSPTSLQGEAAEPGQQAPDGVALEPADVAPSRLAAPKRPAGQPASLPSPKTEAVVPAPAEAPPESAVPRRSRGRETPRPKAAPLAGRLAEELRLLDAMRAASKDGRHADVLRRVREHASSFASGSFAAERELARVRALCGLGRHKQVRLAQAGFAKSFPASHLASMARSACPDASKETRKSDHDE